MEIYSFTYTVDGVLETPSTALAKKFNLFKGINSYYFDGFHSTQQLDGIDWVISFHENVNDIIMAYRLKKRRGAKYYIHLEWLMPWIFNVFYYERDWEYGGSHISEEKIRMFKSLKEVWINADLRTCASKHFIKPLQEFLESDAPVGVKIPGADEELAIAIGVGERTKEFDVVTVSRLVPHKEVAFIARSLIACNTPIKWLLVGDGPELSEIREICKNTKVRLYSGLKVDGVSKYRFLSLGKVAIHGWNGLQPSESILVGTPSLVKDDLVMREYFEGMSNFIDSENAVDVITDYINNFQDKREEALVARQKIFEGEYKRCLFQEAVFVLSEMGKIDGE